jgi:hypothetical protein
MESLRMNAMIQKSQERHIDGKTPATVMAVCSSESLRIPTAISQFFWRVESEREAFEIMRLFPIELLMVNLDMSELDVWQFIKKVKMRDSSIKWVLVSSRLKKNEEIQARALGVTRVFLTMPDMQELYDMAMTIQHNKKRYSILA